MQIYNQGKFIIKANL